MGLRNQHTQLLCGVLQSEQLSQAFQQAVSALPNKSVIKQLLLDSRTKCVTLLESELQSHTATAAAAEASKTAKRRRRSSAEQQFALLAETAWKEQADKALQDGDSLYSLEDLIQVPSLHLHCRPVLPEAVEYTLMFSVPVGGCQAVVT